MLTLIFEFLLCPDVLLRKMHNWCGNVRLLNLSSCSWSRQPFLTHPSVYVCVFTPSPSPSPSAELLVTHRHSARRFPADRLSLNICIHYAVCLCMDVSVCLLNNLRFVQKRIIYFLGVGSTAVCAADVLCWMFPLGVEPDKDWIAVSLSLNYPVWHWVHVSLFLFGVFCSNQSIVTDVSLLPTSFGRSRLRSCGSETTAEK